MKPSLVTAVLERLGVSRPLHDLEGLSDLYAAWCDAVPFDNVRKLVHLSERRPGPLPGSTAEDFFTAWLETGAGGTCWAGNGALHDLLAALGFRVQRVLATMMPSPDTPGPNHGSVAVTLGGGTWLTDASILSGDPLRLPAPGEVPPPSRTLPRVEVRDGRVFVVFRTVRQPDGGLGCRLDRFGATAEEFDALHQRTADSGPFNHSVYVRVNRGANAIAYVMGMTAAFDAAGRLTTAECDLAGRDRFLVHELGISADLVARLPEDRPSP
jgi:N-hydroxyarylamine O-acetyltransferase